MATNHKYSVVFFIHSIDAPGGSEVATRRWAKELTKLGHNVTLVGAQNLRSWIRQMNLLEHHDGLRIIRIPAWQRSEYTYNLFLRVGMTLLLLLLPQTEILHLRSIHASTLYMARIGKRKGLKTLVVPMGSGKYGDLHNHAGRILPEMAKLNQIVCLTEDIRKEVVNWGFPAELTRVISNGVDTNIFKPRSEAQPYSVLFLGQFREEKRLDLLLEAWQRIQRRFPEASLTLIGDTERKPTITELAVQLAINVTISETVPPADIVRHIQQHQILVLPSTSEGMSNALLESMACGLVPVVSDVPGNAAVVTHQHDGLLFEAGSVTDLVEKLSMLLTDQQLVATLSKASRETIVANYSLDSVIAEYVGLYDELLSEW